MSLVSGVHRLIGRYSLPVNSCKTKTCFITHAYLEVAGVGDAEGDPYGIPRVHVGRIEGELTPLRRTSTGREQCRWPWGRRAASARRDSPLDPLEV
eukprot:9080856-Pyramimonas_sp.AAC.1